MKWCQLSFFDESQRHRKLDKPNAPLVKLKAYVDFEPCQSAFLTKNATSPNELITSLGETPVQLSAFTVDAISCVSVVG